MKKILKIILKIIAIIYFIVVLFAMINMMITSEEFKFSIDNEDFIASIFLISPIFLYYFFPFLKYLFKKREENLEKAEKSMKQIKEWLTTFRGGLTAFRDGLAPEYICQNCGAATTEGMFGKWSLSQECKGMGKNSCVPVKNPKFNGDKYK